MACVLVVDDDVTVARLLAALIEEMGHLPLTAADGEEALEALSGLHDAPTLIISDVMMPRMDGVELAHALRQNTAYHDVPIVLMSAAKQIDDGRVADHFIHKPFDLDAIEHLIEQYTPDQHAGLRGPAPRPK